MFNLKQVLKMIFINFVRIYSQKSQILEKYEFNM